MKTSCVSCGAVFCGSIKRSANWYGTNPNKKCGTEATKEQVLASYDDAISTLASHKKLAVIANSTLHNNQTAKDIISRLSPDDGLISVETDLFPDTTELYTPNTRLSNPLPLHNPILRYCSNYGSKYDSVLELNKGDKEIKDKIIKWLESLPKSKTNSVGGVKFSQSDDIETIKFDIESLAKQLLFQKEIAQKLDDFIHDDNVVQKLIEQLPPEITLILKNNATFTVDEERENGINTEGCYLCIVDSSQSGRYDDFLADCDDIFFNDITDCDGQLNKKGIIKWLKYCNSLFRPNAGDTQISISPDSDSDDDDAPKQVIALTTDGREISAVLLPDGTIVSEAEFHFPHAPSYSMINTPEEQFGIDDNFGSCGQKKSVSSEVKEQSEEQDEAVIEDEEDDYDYDEEDDDEYEDDFDYA